MARGSLALGAASHAARVLANVACVLVLTPLLISALGVDGFGAWALCMTILSVLQLLELGATGAATQIAAQERDAPRGREPAATRLLRGRLLRRALLVAPLAWLLAEPLARACGGEVAGLTRALRWVALANVALLPLCLDPGLLQGRGRHPLFNAVSVLGRVIQAGLTLGALQLAPTLEAAVAATLAGALATSLGLWLAARITAPPLPADTPEPDLSELEGAARAFGLINVAVLLSGQSGVLLAGLLLGPAAAGLYRLADRVAHHLAVFLKQVSAVVGPEVAARCAEGAQGQLSSLRPLFVAGCRWTLLLGIPPWLALTCWGDWLLGAWVGPAGRAAGPLAAGLWGTLVLALVQAQAVQLLAYAGEHARVARVFFVTALFDVTLSAFFAAQLGVWGLVLGTLCTVTLTDLFLFVPAGCRRAGLTPCELLRETLGPSWKALSVWAAGLGLARVLVPEPATLSGLVLIGAVTLLAVVVSLATGLTLEERTLAKSLLLRLPGVARGLRLSPA